MTYMNRYPYFVVQDDIAGPLSCGIFPTMYKVIRSPLGAVLARMALRCGVTKWTWLMCKGKKEKGMG